MSFQIFNDHVVDEELRQMFLELKKPGVDYAVSDLAYETIEMYILRSSILWARPRRLKNGRVRISKGNNRRIS